MNCEVFISHHKDSSLHIVEAIANKLEAIGIRCWYAPRNTIGPYAGSIAEAIGNCRVFLLILNQPASESFDVLNEINIACERIRHREDVTLLPFHIADQNISTDAWYYIGRQHWIDAMTPPMYRRIEELVERIVVLLGGDRKPQSGNIQPSTAPWKLTDRMPQAREVFEGREWLIRKIHDAFQSGKTAVFLEGIGGIGKSELAKQYAIEYRDAYDVVVFWVYQDSLCAQFCNDDVIHIENLKPREEGETPQAYFERKLAVLRAIGDGRTLLIVDNFDVDQDEGLQLLLEGKYRVLFTSRNAHPEFTSLRVEAIDDEEVLFRIFEKNYGDCIYESDRPALSEIFQMVDFHTYTIELIAKQMAASFLSAQEMLQILKRGSFENRPLEEVEGRNSRRSAFDHICSLFNMNRLDEEERQIMRCVSIMGNSGVPAKRLKEWVGLLSFDTVNRLIRGSWLRRESGQRISMHPMIRETVYRLLTPTEKNMADILDRLASFCHIAWLRPIAENLEVADNLEAVIAYFAQPSGENYAIFNACSTFLWQVGRFEKATAYEHKVYDATREVYGEASMESGYIARSLAGCYFNSRRREESIPYYKAGLQHMLDSHTTESEDLAICYEKVARCYTWEYEQDFEKAEALLGISLRIRQNLVDQFLNGETPSMLIKYEKYDIAKAYGRLGECYMELGRLYQAEGKYELALESTKKYQELIKLDRDNPSGFAYSLYDMGVSHYHQGLNAAEDGKEEESGQLLDLAEKELQEALGINLHMRGNLAIDVLDNHEVLGDLYAARGRYGDASNAYMAALTIAESLLGQESQRVHELKEKMAFGH